MAPMQNRPARWLATASEAAGLKRRPGTALFRRSYAVKNVLEGKFTTAEMTRNMQPSKGDEHLHQEVYTTDMPAVLHLKRRSYITDGEEVTVTRGLLGIHAVPERPAAEGSELRVCVMTLSDGAQQAHLVPYIDSKGCQQNTFLLQHLYEVPIDFDQQECSRRFSGPAHPSMRGTASSWQRGSKHRHNATARYARGGQRPL